MTPEQEKWLAAFADRGIAEDAVEVQRISENDATAAKQADIDAQIAVINAKAVADIEAVKSASVDTK